MRDWFDTQMEHLREYAEVFHDGLLIVDVLREGDPKPTFRTLVQVDGDMLAFIDSRALNDPEFARAHARHIAHVKERLDALTARPRRWANMLSLVVSGIWTGVTGVVVQESELATQLVGEPWDVLLSVAMGFVVGTIVWPLGRRVLQRLIAWQIGLGARARTNSALERLTGQARDPEPA